MTKPRGMHYVKDKELVWKRVQAGEGFRFINRLGHAIQKKNAERIKDLVIPPAWQDVRVSPDPFGHIQAVGLDDKGRKQYIYHPAWVEFNQQHKFDSLKKFGEILPNLRETIADICVSMNLRVKEFWQLLCGFGTHIHSCGK